MYSQYDNKQSKTQIIQITAITEHIATIIIMASMSEKTNDNNDISQYEHA